MRVALIMLLFAYTSNAQTAAQQKALNNYVDFTNQSADEVAAVVMSVIQYYPTINQKSSWGVPRYSCPIQREEFYLKTALAESRNLPSAVVAGLNKRLNDLESAASAVDEKCKALDTYHKLEDYKKDNFDRARAIIRELQSEVRAYRASQDALASELESAFSRINPTAVQSAYGKADAALKKQIARERAYLDIWTFNLDESVPTGWSPEKLEQSIAETTEALALLKKLQPALKYPASSMWSNFQESLSSVLETKRNALDEYNNEAKKSDRHGNDAYLGLINYFNGTLISDQNAFIQYASNDGYRGIKSIKYFPLFERRSESVVQLITVKPFVDHPRTPLNPPAQKNALSRTAYDALVNYVIFINETWRQTENLAQVLRNVSGDLPRYDKVDSYGRHGALNFDYKDFNIPLAQYQKTISESNQIPTQFAKPLNQQAEVLLNILKELDAISATIEVEAGDAKYDASRTGRVHTLLARSSELLEIWDDRKEQLYQDTRKVYEAFPALKSNSSWYVSGMALQHLTDLDHEGLFKAKAFFQGGQQGTPPSIPTAAIDAALRDVISKEYQNMKGIEKYGRSNGLCPYTPYEDLPETSKRLSQKLNPLKTGAGTGYNHPYYEVLYQYNDVVRHYNQFCELSKNDFLLPTVYQPQLHDINRSKDSAPPAAKTTASSPSVSQTGDKATTSGGGAATSAGTGATAGAAVVIGSTVSDKSADMRNEGAKQAAPAQQVMTEHKVNHDTIYIERRDTVYLTTGNEELRSMEGYAVNNMVLLLDVSGSMNAPEKLPILKSSVLELISMMRPEDKVSIIAFSDKPKAVLTAASFKDETRIQQAISALKSSGKTDGNAGLKLAYKLADENYIRGGNNRIILATDGEFALADPTRELIRKFSTEDIFLSIFNFGKGAGASRALEQIATMGKGNYQYISKENVELQLIREVKAKRAR
ncbi:VWA domain-containing protein [Chryseolinea sp. T2]|uniref:VWA domain-containing protein n=1 Tax=Chryseolinea sp. T2 TaxID=3129255 RepID=UPI003077DEF9